MFPTISARTAVIVVSFISPTCLSLRYDAACCIPLRDLRYLRENTRKSTQSICTKKPQCLPQISLIYADKRQVDQMALLKQMPQISLTKTVTNYSGDIQFILFAVCLRNNAACCIPLRDLRNLRENNTQEDSINPHRGSPNVSRRFRRFTQTKPITTLTTNCLSLRYNAACCIPLRDLRYLRENNGSVCKLGDLTILCIKFSHSEEEESDIIYTSERGPKPF